MFGIVNNLIRNVLVGSAVCDIESVVARQSTIV